MNILLFIYLSIYFFLLPYSISRNQTEKKERKRICLSINDTDNYEVFLFVRKKEKKLLQNNYSIRLGEELLQLINKRLNSFGCLRI